MDLAIKYLIKRWGINYLYQLYPKLLFFQFLRVKMILGYLTGCRLAV